MPFPVTTGSAKAQRYVDQGIALHWGFNHAEAVRSFRAAKALDPGTCRPRIARVQPSPGFDVSALAACRPLTANATQPA